MTAENLARELRRLEHIIDALDDGTTEYAPYNWLGFIDPVRYGFTVGQSIRYSLERTCLTYGTPSGRDPQCPSALISNSPTSFVPVRSTR